MSNNLEILLNEVQLKTRLTLEQIAQRLGYSRPYLNKMKKNGGNQKLEKMLKETFPEVLQNDTPPADRTDHLIQTLERTNKTLETIILANLTGVNTNLTVLTEVIKTNQLMIDSIQVRQSAQHTVMLGSLDRIEGKKEGTLLVKASKLENDLRQEVQARSKQTALDSKSM